MSLIKAKLRVSMLYYETENLLKVSGSKFINLQNMFLLSWNLSNQN